MYGRRITVPTTRRAFDRSRFTVAPPGAHYDGRAAGDSKLGSIVIARGPTLTADNVGVYRLNESIFKLTSVSYTVCPKKSEPLNILQQRPQICSDLNKIIHTQDDICYKHYYIVLYKSALTLLKYEFLNNITHKS